MSIIAILDLIGFFLAGGGTVGALFAITLINQQLLFGNDGETVLSIASILRPFWLNNALRKKFALWVIDKGVMWTLAFATIGFLLQIPSKLCAVLSNYV